MFANLLQLFARGPAETQSYDLAFVKDVDVQPAREPRNRRVEGRLVLGWLAILLKCALLAWAVPHYRVPINAAWIILPTLAMAAVCTALYVWRR